MPSGSSGQRTIVVHTPPGTRFCATHEKMAHIEIARRIAALKGGSFGGQFDGAVRYPERPYFLPTDTIVGMDVAHRLGIFDEHDLFGGVVPHGFIGTKAITHGLVSDHARSPANWSAGFANEVCGIVPRGYTAFCIEDARTAVNNLLSEGPVRVKTVKATGGRGQSVIRSISEFGGLLEKLDHAQVEQFGLVLEENLATPRTYSVGQIRLGGLVASYYGVQNLVRDNFGRIAYGGSDLAVVRGDFDELVRISGPQDEVRTAIDQAQRYDAAATRHFPGIIASRRNYDVICGTSAAGRRCWGVLEQSWRIGGATPAEITALEAFTADPGLKMVDVSSVEAYGTRPPRPAGAIVYFEGDDREVGPITKYAYRRSA